MRWELAEAPAKPAVKSKPNQAVHVFLQLLLRHFGSVVHCPEYGFRFPTVELDDMAEKLVDSSEVGILFSTCFSASKEIVGKLAPLCCYSRGVFRCLFDYAESANSGRG